MRSDIGIPSLLKSPTAAAFASHSAAYLMASDYLQYGRRTQPGLGALGDIALHEAGHAIVMAALGETLAAIELIDGDSIWGGVVIPGSHAGADRAGLSIERIGTLMCSYMAGYLAEIDTTRLGFSRSAHDFGITFYLALAAESLTGTITAKAALRAALSLSKTILVRNQSQLLRLRNVLHEKRRLGASEIVECITGIERTPSMAWVDLARAGGGAESFNKEENALSVACAIANAPGVLSPAPTAPARRDTAAAVAAIEQSERVALMFSGGKESLVLAHMLKAHRDRITLVWMNTGAMFPHMAGFIRGFAKEHGYELVVLHSDQKADFSRFGWPARVIPIYRNPDGRIKTDSAQACCYRLRGRPIIQWMLLHGVNTVAHGQRLADDSPFSFVGECEEIAPLWHWSEADVYRYLSEHSIQLPEQYAHGYPDSGECWNCTAEIDPKRFKWMRRRYPELLEQVVPMIATVYGPVNDYLATMRPGFDAALSGYDELQAERAAR